MKKILLGFEVGTGEPVYMRLHHTVFTGMTSISGKTTGLEAVIFRTEDHKAIAFKTKRGEAGFSSYHEVPPFYVERSDWRYVQTLLEAAMRERMRFERAWIIRASKGTKSLGEVLENTGRLKEKARPGSLSENVYTVLEEYLKIVVPQVDAFDFSDKLDLQEGINVMDLAQMSVEMRSLVIRSVMEFVIGKMKNVIVIVPEAWEYLPQRRSTPVKWYAETFIRKGASIGNFLFVDSQDIAGIDKTPLRSCDNWIMGRQKEAHEVNRVREILGKTVSEEEIRRLKLGHFYAYVGDQIKLTYLLPAGVPEEVGRKVALGELAPDYVRDKYLKRGKEVDEEMWRERYEELNNRFEQYKSRTDVELKSLRERLKKRVRANDEAERKLREQSKAAEELKDRFQRYDNLVDTLVGVLEPRIRGLFKEAIKVGQTQATLQKERGKTKVAIDHEPIRYEIQETELQTVTMTTRTNEGKILYVAKKDLVGYEDGWTEKDLQEKLQEYGWPIKHATLAPTLAGLVKKGLLVRTRKAGERAYRYRLPTRVLIEVAKEENLTSEQNKD